MHREHGSRHAGTEACLLFPTGFAANLGTIAALCGNADTAIFSDELNHASIVDGCRLAVRQGATLQVAFCTLDPDLNPGLRTS